MTARDSARQHAEKVEQLAAQIQRTHNPFQAARLATEMHQEARELRKDVERARTEESSMALAP